MDFKINDRVAHRATGSTATVVGLGTGRPDGSLDVRWDKPIYGEIEVSGDWRRNFRLLTDEEQYHDTVVTDVNID